MKTGKSQGIKNGQGFPGKVRGKDNFFWKFKIPKRMVMINNEDFFFPGREIIYVYQSFA